MTRMEFTGKTAGTQTFMRVFGQKLTQTYRGGNNPTAKYADVAEADVELLLRTGKWAVVRRPVEAGGEAGAGNVPAPKPINYDEPVQVVEDEPSATPEEQDTEIEATPQAEAEAQAAGLNLADISGTGKDGKITVMDVRNAVREQS